MVDDSDEKSTKSKLEILIIDLNKELDNIHIKN